MRYSSTTATGISNVSPNATNIPSTNDKYLSMSVAMLTPSGVIPAKNLNTIGKTRK